MASARRVGMMFEQMAARSLIRVVGLSFLAASCHSGASRVRAPEAHASAMQIPTLSASARLARANQRLELSAYPEAEADFRALAGDCGSGSSGAWARPGAGHHRAL